MQISSAVHAQQLGSFLRYRSQLPARLFELAIIVGCYSLVSLTLNAFRVPLREGMANPFENSRA